MSWIVIGTEKETIKLVSKNNVQGLLPNGTFLTIEQPNSDAESTKFIVRVDDSIQHSPYSPSPSIIDMDLEPLLQDQKCQNIITATRVKTINSNVKGLIQYIRPQVTARKSTIDEIRLGLNSPEFGPDVFLAAYYANENMILMDDEEKFVSIKLPRSMFFYQTLICGRTGSGKTVVLKNFAHYFAEKLPNRDNSEEIDPGAVLVVNVKDIDFCTMDTPSTTKNPNLQDEWKSIGEKPHPVEDFIVYYPASCQETFIQGVTQNILKKVTLDVNTFEPDALTGILTNISELGIQSLPNIFRYWQENQRKDKIPLRFSDFITYFNNGVGDKYVYKTRDKRGNIGDIKIFPGTHTNIAMNLQMASELFDNEDEGVVSLTENDILQPGRISVINVVPDSSKKFGPLLLRDLLSRIVKVKKNNSNKVPILIIIDEVHMFYDSKSSREALGDLDTICRTGRSQEIGIIFASQNPSDLPDGVSQVINTKFFFNSDSNIGKKFGIFSQEDMTHLKTGFACCNIKDMDQVTLVKFPLSLSGVNDR